MAAKPTFTRMLAQCLWTIEWLHKAEVSMTGVVEGGLTGRLMGVYETTKGGGG